MTAMDPERVLGILGMNTASPLQGIAHAHTDLHTDLHLFSIANVLCLFFVNKRHYGRENSASDYLFGECP